VIWVLVRIFAGEISFKYFSIVVAILAFFSSLPFFAGLIMPDILTFAYDPCDLSSQFPVASFVEIGDNLLHLIGLHSNNCAYLASAAGLPPRFCGARIDTRGILSVLSTTAILLNNIVIHHSFALFPAGQSLANMIEHGPARRYLQETCPAADYKICRIAKSLPMTSHELLWAADAYRELGGFDGMREEAAQIVRNTFRSRPWDVLQMTVDTVGSPFVTHAPHLAGPPPRR